MGGYNNIEDKKEKSKAGSIMKKKSRKYVALIVVVAATFWEYFIKAIQAPKRNMKRLSNNLKRKSIGFQNRWPFMRRLPRR